MNSKTLIFSIIFSFLSGAASCYLVFRKDIVEVHKECEETRNFISEYVGNLEEISTFAKADSSVSAIGFVVQTDKQNLSKYQLREAYLDLLKQPSKSLSDLERKTTNQRLLKEIHSLQKRIESLKKDIEFRF